MPATLPPPGHAARARAAGAFYLIILVAGLSAELAVRQPILTAGDDAARWQVLTGALPLFRASIAADAVMLLADIALAVLLYAIFRTVQREVALAALVLRLIQAAVIAASVIAALGALMLAADGASPETALRLIELHGAGYDFGLIFFGVNTLLTAWLLARSGFGWRWLPGLLALAGLVYLAGSFTRILAPALNAAMQPAYGVPVLAETLFAVALLTGLAPRRSAQPG